MSRRRKNRLLERLEHMSYHLLGRVVRRLSDESAQRWGTRLGRWSGRLLRSRDSLAMRNLRAVFPQRSERDLRAIAGAAWMHFGREMIAFVRAQTLSLDEIAHRCPFHGAEILERALDRGKGVVLISAHFGSWEIGGLAIMSLVKNTLTVARPLDNSLLERDLATARARTGAAVVDRKRAARPLLKALAENRVVILLPDQAVQPREGVLVPFLGLQAWTTDAPAKMALRSGSTIVFTFCIPDGTRHRLEFEEPIDPEALSQEERDSTRLTERINEVISRRIASHPELWLWMHDRWKGTGERNAHAE